MLAVPAYLLSVLVEWRVLLRFVESSSRPSVLRTVAFANLLSYIGLAALFVFVMRSDDSLNRLFAMFQGVISCFTQMVHALWSLWPMA